MIYFLKRMLPFLLLFLACKDMNDKTAEEIIKIIQDKGLQKALFDCFDDEEYLLEVFQIF